MEQEKKKRWRPSLGEYRALERTISELRDGSATAAEYNDLLAKNNTLDKHNSQMAKELDKLRLEIKEQDKEIADLNREITYLRNRGFWGRVFNT